MIDPAVAANVRRMRDDPVAFIEHILGSKLWHKQKIIARALVKYRKVPVRSCHSSGKTHLAARLALWWLFTRPYSSVITTAPTARQVNRLLWKEIRIAYKNAPNPLGGRLMPEASALKVDDGWTCVGFTARDGDSFQGDHAPGGVLVIADEAAGIQPNIWQAIDAVLTGENDRLLAIANPTEASGPFYDMCRRLKGFQISAFDVPNVKEGKTVIPGLCSREWVEEKRLEWGEDSPMWQSRVLGEFPKTDEHALCPLSWVEAAFNLHEATEHWGQIERLGVDVARFGPDNTIIVPSNHLGAERIIREPKQSIPATAGSVLRILRDTGARYANIDADGMGAGVYDLVAAEEPDRAVEMRGGREPSDKVKYFNARSEWMWNLRELLDPSQGDPIALPRDERLQHQLTSIKWDTTPKGQIKIESKKDMIKRGLKSPDEADAVAYSMASSGKEFVFV